MSEVSISFMQKSELEKAAGVLSVAMLDNPMHVAVYKSAGEDARIEIEKDFIGLFNERPGVVFLAKEGQEIIGVMRMYSCLGKDAGKEIPEPEPDAGVEQRIAFWHYQWDSRDPNDEHWHLGPIGVLPAYQGRGVGSMLMKRFCAEVDVCGAPAFLETDKAVNVDFYRKFGFEAIEEPVIFGVINTFMFRAA